MSYQFDLLNRDRGIRTRYTSTFVPRVGDKICIGDLYLKVVDVVMQSAQSDGAGVMHSLEVHVTKIDSLSISDDSELEVNEFCRKSK